MIEAFRAESDFEVREFLIEIIWQHRQPSVIPFLGEALRDPKPAVWQQAIDGLVTLASPAALDVLRTARDSATGEFRAWLEEAIEQVEELLRNVAEQERLFQLQQFGKRAGWDDPEMDVYDDLDPRRKS